MYIPTGGHLQRLNLETRTRYRNSLYVLYPSTRVFPCKNLMRPFLQNIEQGMTGGGDRDEPISNLFGFDQIPTNHRSPGFRPSPFLIPHPPLYLSSLVCLIPSLLQYSFTFGHSLFERAAAATKPPKPIFQLNKRKHAKRICFRFVLLRSNFK